MDVAEREQIRSSEQARLDSLKTAAERNRLGQFATPPALALDIAKHAQKILSDGENLIRFLDPAIGTGSFFSACLATFPAGKISGATGIEIDSAFAAVANKLWESSGLRMVNADFTTLPAPEKRFNLIVANPPYVRHHHISKEEKDRLRTTVGQQLRIDMSGLAGLYCYFLLLADAWLDAEGIAIWLIPSEFMDVNYGTAVKQYLTEKVTLLQIHRFCPSDVQFDDALVSSAVVLFKKSPSPEAHCVRFSFGGALSEPNRSEVIALDALRDCGKWTSLPTSSVTNSRKNEIMLGDLFTVKRGIATGDNSFFILPREKALQFGIPDSCLRPILPSPRYLKESIVDADHDGYPKLVEPLALIDCTFSEEDIQRSHPAFWEYLAAGKANHVDEGYLTSRRTPWYSQERREASPFLCTYMGRSRGTRKPFRFIWNRSQATAANVYLLLYPKADLRRALDSDSSLYGKVFEALNQIEEGSFKSEGRVYGGGLYKMEPAELCRLPAERIAAVAGLDLNKPRQLLAFA